MRAAGGRAWHAEGPWPLPGLLLLLLLLPLPCPRRPFSPPDTGGGAASRSGLDLPRGLERCQMRVRMECWQVAGAKDEVGFHLPGLRTAPRADVASPPPARAERKKAVSQSLCMRGVCGGHRKPPPARFLPRLPTHPFGRYDTDQAKWRVRARTGADRWARGAQGWPCGHRSSEDGRVRAALRVGPHRSPGRPCQTSRLVRVGAWTRAGRGSTGDGKTMAPGHGPSASERSRAAAPSCVRRRSGAQERSTGSHRFRQKGGNIASTGRHRSDSYFVRACLPLHATTEIILLGPN